MQSCEHLFCGAYIWANSVHPMSKVRRREACFVWRSEPHPRGNRSVVDEPPAKELMNGSPAAHNSNHTQSGHYIWPAAAVLCSYMMDHWQALPHGSVLELGAGVGLAGLVAAHLKGTTVVVFTDHDPGVLSIIYDSIAENQQAACLVEGGGMTDVARGGMARSRCVQLSWGHVGEEQQAALLKALNGHRPWEDDQPRSVPQQKQADYVPSVSPESKNRRVDPFFQQASGHKLNESVGVSASPQVGAETGAGSEAGGGEGEGAGEGTVPGTGAGGGPVGPVTCTQDQGDVWGGARASEGASFDLIIASDVIYSASVVAPLFRTVQDLLSPPSSPREEGKQYACHAAQSRYHSYASDPPAPCPLRRPRGTAMTTEGLSSQVVPTFLMCQSFAYDAATEETIDRACAE
ncbi:unnamed protein product, partial [Discosporangium mesarthrocarpum]